MNIIFNDFSLHGQYNSIKEFVDDLYKYTLKPANLLKTHNYQLLGRYDTYNRNVTSDVVLNELLQTGRGFPELSKIKIFLTSIMYDPFWESNIKTDSDATYYSELIEINKNKPNSFTESIERDKLLFSIKDDTFDCDDIMVKKNDSKLVLKNIKDTESASKLLFSNNDITFSEMLSISLDSHNAVFCKDINGKFYADSGFEDSSFDFLDGIKILKDLTEFICESENDVVREKFHDTITHKGITYHEFRTSLSQHRLFRIYYFLQGNNKCFINSLAKKTQTIPNRVKDFCVDLIKKLNNN